MLYRKTWTKEINESIQQTMSNALQLLPLLALGVTACGEPAADPNIADPLGRCLYVNSFSDRGECREYYGSDWTPEAMEDDCGSPVPGADPGVVELDVGCDREEVLGECLVDAGTVDAYTIVFPGSDPEDCSGLSMGCGFAGGEYVPAETCGGVSAGGPTNYTPFVPLEQVCIDPVEGEPGGLGPDGQVCTQQAISGATEEGRHFADYASCDVVLTQRPYWVNEISANTPDDDPRYTDLEWQQEYAWVTGQVESSGCICCHSTEVAPDGPSGWYIEADGLWVDTFYDDGMAMMAGWVDSTVFGAFPPEQNNGFARVLTGMLSNDPERMRDFFEAELARRGRVQSDFDDTEPFGGPLVDQARYEPERCDGGEGVADGVVTWRGGAARYLYVLEADAANPGTPPNLDLPDGTLWRVDVAPTDDPIDSGIEYGVAPDNAAQRFPVDAAPPALELGKDYYLYAMFDVAVPITRCIFTAR